ncbi:MAG: NifU family protein [Acidimicrobiales bacterium]|jgi:Fe/S biogenesis protein NfuA|nr:NifU family protein [Acidimicrobiales bacterium]MDP6298974.1 NifU family protein [Acidimicrobiales bacterium]HJM28380.1 NifU family protein [Acidimicrobiales bacterium]HJM97155.1 NifU family protein [Acidimicrobiales bacterium]
MAGNETKTEETVVTVLEVTDAALAKVLEVRSEEDNPQSTGLRIRITGANGPEFSYDLSFEDVSEAQADDHIYQVDDLVVIIPKKNLDDLNGATLDLPSNPMQGGLVIRNPNRPNMLEGADIELSGTPGEKLQQLLDQHINPSLAAHGGYAELKQMEGTVAHILMGGGCQGCAMSAATLRQGIEVMIAEAIPEITEVVDVTDHEAGENPFFEQ